MLHADAPSPPHGPAPGVAGARPPGLRDGRGRRIDYLRLSVTDRCNYRCTYCMPEDGVDHARRADILSFEEIAALVACFARLGVRSLRITGGEPTVRRDLVKLVALLRAIPGLDDLALTTNGQLLAELAAPLARAGVKRLNVSVDTLQPDRFRRITRRGDLDAVLRGLEAARGAGFAAIKLNVVAIRGFNDDELGELCRYAFARGFVPRFIEVMPMAAGQLYVPGELIPAAAIRAAIARAFPGHEVVPDPDGRRVTQGAGPARYFHLRPRTPAAVPGAPPRFGIISPMTEHFCDDCNRVRLSAAGHLHGCLAHDDAVDLRRVLHAEGPDAVVRTIQAELSRKREGHLFQVSGLGGPRKAMVAIGG